MGNTWLQFSHKYTVADALAQAAEAGESDAGVLTALRALYGGDVSKTTGYTVAFAGKHSCRLSFQAGVDSHCVQNIQRSLSLGGFGGAALPRVHPLSWIALLQAARDANVGALEITSGWRPMTGKAPHRIGLGLNVKSAKSVSGTSLVFDKDSPALWSGPEEKEAHADWLESEGELDKAKVEMAAAQKALKAAKEEGKALAQQRLKDADRKLTDALVKRDQSKGEMAEGDATPGNPFYRLGEWYVHLPGSRGDDMTPALCNYDDDGRYSVNSSDRYFHPNMKFNVKDIINDRGTFGCREWAYQMKRPISVAGLGGQVPDAKGQCQGLCAALY